MWDVDKEKVMQDPDNNESPYEVAGVARCFHARVYSKDGSRYGVAGTMGCYWLPVAVSCLLQPAVGDTVLISISDEGGYILAVLAQANSEHSELRLPGSARLAAKTGSLTLSAAQGVKIEAGSGLQLQARAASFAFEVLGIRAQRMQVTGDSQQTVWRERRDFIEHQLVVTGQTEQRSGARVTRIVGHDECSAGSQRIIVQRDWRVRAGGVDIQADKKVSLDGQQVQLG